MVVIQENIWLRAFIISPSQLGEFVEMQNNQVFREKRISCFLGCAFFFVKEFFSFQLLSSPFSYFPAKIQTAYRHLQIVPFPSTFYSFA